MTTKQQELINLVRRRGAWAVACSAGNGENLTDEQMEAVLAVPGVEDQIFDYAVASIAEFGEGGWEDGLMGYVEEFVSDDEVQEGITNALS